VVNGRAHRVEQRPQPRKVAVRRADHEETFAAIGVAREPPDGSVGKRAALRRDRVREPVGRHRIDRAHVDDERAGPRVGEQAADPRDHLFDDRRVRQHREDHVARRSDVGVRARGLRLQRRELAHRLGIHVVHDQPKPLPAEIRRHRTAHSAEPDETDGERARRSLCVHALFLRAVEGGCN
jgi:hypothetical protein